MKKVILFYIVVAVIFSCEKPNTYDIVIQNVNLFNGYEDRGKVNIAINKDTVAAISTETLVGDSLIDATGTYVIPGLVNAHVHASNLSDLKEGYPLGILTLLNMHTGLENRELEWKKIAEDSLGYSVLYGAGQAATVPKGHPTQFSQGMETISDSLTVESWLENRIKNKVDFIKIVRDNHEWMGYPALPTLEYDTIAKLIKAAQQKGYKAVVHANTTEEMMEIAKFKPDGFVHMLEFKEDYPLSDTYYNAIANSGAFVVTTGGISLKAMDGAPPFMVEWIANNLLDAQERAEIIKGYHQNGIMIVAGTDAQQGQMNFGKDYFLELELFKMAGLSNLEIMQAATGNAAKAFELPIGEIVVGGKANMVLLRANPIDDINNLNAIEQVWKNGKTN